MLEKNSQGVSMPLFMEDIYEALRAAVQALGGAKKVGPLLWPTKPDDAAKTNLLDCLNRDNPRKFEVEEVMTLLRMAREAGFHRTKHWIDQATGYRESEPLDPALEEDRLATVIENATTTLAAALKQANDIRSGKLRSVA